MAKKQRKRKRSQKPKKRPQQQEEVEVDLLLLIDAATFAGDDEVEVDDETCDKILDIKSKIGADGPKMTVSDWEFLEHYAIQWASKEAPHFVPGLRRVLDDYGLRKPRILV